MKIERINLSKSNGKEVTYYKFHIIIPNGVEISTYNITKNNMILSYENTDVSLDISCRDVFILQEDFNYYLLIEETFLDIDKNIGCLLDEDYIIEDMGIILYDKHNNEISVDIEPIEQIIKEQNNDREIVLRGDVRIGFNIVFNSGKMHDYDMFLMNKLDDKVSPIFYNNIKGHGFSLEGYDYNNCIADIQPVDSVFFNVDNINSDGFDILISSYDEDYKVHDIEYILILIKCNGVDYVYKLNCDDFNEFNIDVNTKTIKFFECEYLEGNYYLKPNITSYLIDMSQLIVTMYGEVSI